MKIHTPTQLRKRPERIRSVGRLHWKVADIFNLPEILPDRNGHLG